jgi:hypothetical protein
MYCLSPANCVESGGWKPDWLKESSPYSAVAFPSPAQGPCGLIAVNNRLSIYVHSICAPRVAH